MSACWLGGAWRLTLSRRNPWGTDVKDKRRSALNESPAAPAMLGIRLADMLVDAAMAGQGMWGRGVLCVRCDSGSLAWTFKPLAECTEEVSEWAELERLVTGYDPKREILIGLFGDGAEFFRLPVGRDSGRS
jgi:hypothetical protein